MGRKRKDKLQRGITIEKYAAEGKSIAYINEMVVFVDGAVPGDVCDILVTRKRKSYWQARLYHLHEPSDLRKNAKCSYFGVCGGCKWQHLDYEKQLEFKQQQVSDAMQRIGKVELGAMDPIMGSDSIYNYRNKLDFSFSHKRWMTKEEVDSEVEIVDEPALGFHVPGRWDKVLDVHECHLQPDPSNAIRNRVRDLAKEHDFSYYDLYAQKGLLRGLVLRNTTQGDWMLILVLGEDNHKAGTIILDSLISEFPELKSVFLVINTKQNDSLHDLEMNLYHGSDHILEEMEDLKFRIGPKSFFQTNGLQAYELYKVTREFADLKGTETVYDLYTGTGTIALFVAKQAAKVVGIEYVEAAIDDAKINAEFNGVEHAHFYAGDMKDVFSPELIAKEGHPDVVITDPPRAGMHQNVIDRLNELKPKKIVYVSCNPATQARDLNLLSENYEVARIRPVDMFPHTHHVENVVLLKLKN